jgi:uncharacterized protein YeaO (DUF488 family)
MMGADVRVRRVYDEPSPADGARVLVDRVWPRGMRKDAARLDERAKDVAPSAELRTWYQHDPARFDEFRCRYTAELAQPGTKEALARLRALAADRPVTLLTATRNLDLSQAALRGHRHRAIPREPCDFAEARSSSSTPFFPGPHDVRRAPFRLDLHALLPLRSAGEPSPAPKVPAGRTITSLSLAVTLMR